MRAGLTAFFQRVADGLVTGDVEWIAGHFNLPLPIHIGPDLRIHQQKSAAIQYLKACHAQLAKAEVKKSIVELKCFNQQSDLRACLGLEFVHFGAQDQILGKNRIRFYCVVPSDVYRIELVEHIDAEDISINPTAALRKT